MNSQFSDSDSTNFIAKIRAFVTQEEEEVKKRFDEITRLYTEAFLTIQRVDEERTTYRA